VVCPMFVIPSMRALLAALRPRQATLRFWRKAPATKRKIDISLDEWISASYALHQPLGFFYREDRFGGTQHLFELGEGVHKATMMPRSNGRGKPVMRSIRERGGTELILAHLDPL